MRRLPIDIQFSFRMWYNSQMHFLRQSAAGMLGFFLSLPAAHAAPLRLITGVTSTVPSIFAGIVNTLLLWSGSVTTALFLLGALLMVGSGGNDATLSNGKKIMQASLIGLAIILSSWLILSTAVAFISG